MIEEAQNQTEITFRPTQTVREFMLSSAYVRVLAGPIGGGKSVACVHELLRWASEQAPNKNGVRKTRFLICRNTADQLRSTTLKTIFDWLPPSLAGAWVATEKTFYIKYGLPDGTTVETEWMAIALDTPDDVRKALSLEATGLWGNEARELHPEVVEGLLMRVNRYPSPKDGGPTRPGAIFDTNMPQEGSWWHERMINPPENWSIHIQPPAVLTPKEFIDKYGIGEFRGVFGRHEVVGVATSDGNVRLSAITKSSVPNVQPVESNLVAKSYTGDIYITDPNAENFGNLNASYYPQTLIGKSTEFINVYLRCKFGQSKEGRPVFDSFRRDFHVAKGPLVPVDDRNRPLLIGMDFGLTPACTICQTDVRGRLLVLDEITTENMGIYRFIHERLRPLLSERFPRFPVVVIGDPAGAQRAQTDERSVFDVLRSEGFQVVPAPTNSLAARLAAIEKLLTYAVDGVAAHLIDPRCKMLIAAFLGGYRYRLRRTGEFDDKPEKNSYSHVMDAHQYVCSYVVNKLAPGGVVFDATPKAREIRRVSMRGWL